MRKEIEKMIRFATEDGSITDKEREIIMRKAQEMGADIDEVEIMLENELAKHYKIVEAPKSIEKRPKEKIRKCPRCGAVVTDSSLSCPECGYSFSEQSAASEDAQKQIESLKEQLLQVNDRVKFAFDTNAKKEAELKKKTIISTFVLPKTKEGLIQFLEFSYSNYIGEDSSSGLKDIWKGKFLQAYNSLKALGEKDPEINNILNVYSDEYNTEKDSRLKERKIAAYPWGKIGCLSFFVIMIIAGLLQNLIDQNKDKPILNEINELILKEDFDKALNKTIELSSDIKIESTQDRILEKQAEHLSSDNIDKAIEVSLRIKDERKRDKLYNTLLGIKRERINQDNQ